MFKIQIFIFLDYFFAVAFTLVLRKSWSSPASPWINWINPILFLVQLPQPEQQASVTVHQSFSSRPSQQITASGRCSKSMTKLELSKTLNWKSIYEYSNKSWSFCTFLFILQPPLRIYAGQPTIITSFAKRLQYNKNMQILEL